MYMPRVVQLSDEAYGRLRNLKRPDESFSDVVLRLTGRGDLRRLKGLRSRKAIDAAEALLAEIDALDR